eukprot:FR741056.1.p1 GENE.FR741056.1~~FR741056.1.p1  ORF type:complete len:358 (+),score=121.24 FR741056.1:149-1075(+)
MALESKPFLHNALYETSDIHDCKVEVRLPRQDIITGLFQPHGKPLKKLRRNGLIPNGTVPLMEFKPGGTFEESLKARGRNNLLFGKKEMPLYSTEEFFSNEGRGLIHKFQKALMGKQQPIAVDQMVVYTIPEKDRKRNNVVEDELVGKVLSVSGDTTLANSEVMIKIAKFQRTDRGRVAHECFDPLASYEGIKYKHGGGVTVEVSRTSVLYGLAFKKTGAPMTTPGVPGEPGVPERRGLFPDQQKAPGWPPCTPKNDFFPAEALRLFDSLLREEPPRRASKPGKRGVEGKNPKWGEKRKRRESGLGRW